MRVRVRFVVCVAVGLVALVGGATVAGIGETSDHVGCVVPGVLIAVIGIVLVGIAAERESHTSSRRARRDERLVQRLGHLFGEDRTSDR